MCEEYKWDDPQEPILCLLEDRKEYCLFHAPGDLKDHEALMDAAWERVNCVLEANVGLGENDQISCDLSGTAFGEDVDFGGMVFPSINFMSNSFGGESLFLNAIFNQEAIFDGSCFGEMAHFDFASFKTRVSFDLATFCDMVGFTFASFGGETIFIQTSFKDRIDFDFSIFSEQANFKQASLEGNTYFDYTKFKGKAFFSSASFSSYVNFDNAFFSEESSFLKTTFKKLASFSQTTFNEVSFALSRFYEEPVFDRADLRKAELLGAPVEDFRLMACKLPTRRGRRITYDARKVNGIGYFPLDNVNTVSTLEEIPPPGHLEDLYRRLKKVARREHDETLASDFHYAEKEMQRHRGWDMLTNCKRSRENNHGFCLRDRARGLGLWLVLSLYRFISGYGESPLRAFGALMLLVLLPGALMHPLPVHLPLWLAIFGLMAFPKGFFLPFWLGAVSLWFLPHIPNSLENLDLGASWLHFIPLVKLPKAAEFDWLPRALMLCSQVAITLQAALFGFALRNRFRR